MDGLSIDSFYLNILIIVVMSLPAVYWYLTSNYNYWKDKGVPFLKPEPIFGNFRNMVLLRKTAGQEFIRCYKELEGHDLGGVYQSKRPALIIRSPELIKHVLVKDFAHFHDRGMPFNEKLDPLSGHLFNLEGTRWRNLRAKLTPTFTSGKMKMMFQVLNDCGDELKKYLDEPASTGEPIDFKEVLAKFTTDIIGTCAFGLQFNSMKDSESEFRAMGRKVFQPSFTGNVRRILLFFTPWIAKVLRITFLSKDVRNFFLSVVKETVKYREDNNFIRNDFMDLLIQLKHKGVLVDDHEGPQEQKGENNLEVTDEVIAAQAFVFFLAGFETSSSTMSFCLYELALHTDVQQKLRNEVIESLEMNEGHLTYEAILKMEYMNQVVEETLRKYPPVPNLIRKCTKPYKIPGTSIEIEKGTRVFIPAYAIHHDPTYYPEPEKFIPERFSNEEQKKRPNYTYLPFGEGPRVCIGLRFGMMQTKVGLAVILANYHVKICEKTTVPLVLDPKAFVTSAKGGMWLKLEPYQ